METKTFNEMLSDIFNNKVTSDEFRKKYCSNNARDIYAKHEEEKKVSKSESCAHDATCPTSIGRLFDFWNMDNNDEYKDFVPRVFGIDYDVCVCPNKESPVQDEKNKTEKINPKELPQFNPAKFPSEFLEKNEELMSNRERLYHKIHTEFPRMTYDTFNEIFDAGKEEGERSRDKEFDELMEKKERSFGEGWNCLRNVILNDVVSTYEYPEK